MLDRNWIQPWLLCEERHRALLKTLTLKLVERIIAGEYRIIEL